MKNRNIVKCSNCDSVHVVSDLNKKCEICNGDLIHLDGIQSVINAILEDKTIDIFYSNQAANDIIERPYFGWTMYGLENLKK